MKPLAEQRIRQNRMDQIAGMTVEDLTADLDVEWENLLHVAGEDHAELLTWAESVVAFLVVIENSHALQEVRMLAGHYLKLTGR